ncbi:LPS export ABC transporter permease LptG [Xanthobacter oligotrophicus]|uniref:LPS export ABC transporter permease LptG n=1 Tax=Xanthobacter oligotrophicus TaxID=2607286 RepID=UPI0011F151E6|nr:LPS export ABC transporter permease LptG [Xanthobacter oligotrophicus]MCG5236676.1 LPS export ABC transporter permease LptG [Xanthobacter oligotrophicus]
MIGRILGFYFARRFASAVVLIFLSCVTLIVLVDFLEMARRTADREQVTVGLLALVTLYRAPSFTEQLMPFAVLFGAISTFVLLSRRLELVVARAVGLSVWQFITPPVLVAFLIGIFSTTVFNPVSADFKERANQIEGEIFGSSSSGLLPQGKKEFWVRQQSVDGQSIIQAQATRQGGRALSGVVVFEFDKADRLVERVEARSATLGDGAWILTDAKVLVPGLDHQRYDTYVIATNLDPKQIQESLIAPETVSFWQLPAAIRSAEQSGFGAERYRLQLQSLLARPFLLVAMVLIAAVVGLRVFRFGGVGQTILGGVLAGFLLYVGTKLAEDLGEAGFVHPVAAAWFPAVTGILLGVLILLHREDG